MKSIILATGNKRKVQEANESLAGLGIVVIVQPVDIDEIQHHDAIEISKAKARAAYDVIQKPVVVQDTTWSIPSLGGFPGGYMKDVAHWWSPNDWMAIMAQHQDRSIICSEHVVYYDGVTLKDFHVEYEGIFVDSPRGNDGDSIDKTVTLHSGKTMAQMHDEGKVGSADEALPHWKLFGEWYQFYE
jgi:non-canonical purine NTP pyrophosphatase (RdgB/HAM1 family)